MLRQLPSVSYDYEVDRSDVPDMWPGGQASYAMRWDAITKCANEGSAAVDLLWQQLGGRNRGQALRRITDIFVVPIFHFLVDQLYLSSAALYTLLRYKRWAEWFEASRLRELYEDRGNGGEAALDESLRRFLFESGIDYPFSQPTSPRGRADVVAGLETDDPLVPEIKVWDSAKGYKLNRVRDGLRQVMDYATKYGKDRGYLVVFNLDRRPLSFIGPVDHSEWPPHIDRGGRTFFFVDVHIAEQEKPISQQDKGRPVGVNEIRLMDLLESNTP
jgi:hypothetical protein